jgi:hypothetical protein
MYIVENLKKHLLNLELIIFVTDILRIKFTNTYVLFHSNRLHLNCSAYLVLHHICNNMKLAANVKNVSCQEMSLCLSF